MTPRRRGARRPAPGSPAPLDAGGARRVALELLARKAWSRRDLTRRLARRGAPLDIAEGVVADLAARGYLDDEGFARWWAESRAEHRRVGSVRLRRELLARGIAPDLAAAAAGAPFEAASELDRAMEAASKRLPALLRKGREHAPVRLGNYLLRRGYPAGVTTRVVKALLAEDLDAPAAPAEDGIV